MSFATSMSSALALAAGVLLAPHTAAAPAEPVTAPAK